MHDSVFQYKTIYTSKSGNIPFEADVFFTGDTKVLLGEVKTQKEWVRSLILFMASSKQLSQKEKDHSAQTITSV